MFMNNMAQRTISTQVFNPFIGLLIDINVDGHILKTRSLQHST
jgi:hypothetical protein